MNFFNKLAFQYTKTRELGPLTLLFLLSVVFYLANPAFLSIMNISNMLAFIPEIGIIALGMTMLLTGGEFDLSVGSVFGSIPVLMFIFYNEGFLSIEASFFVALLLAAFIGFVSGLFVTKVGISSFLVTIGMMLIVRGTALYVSHGFPQSTWEVESGLKAALVGTVQIGKSDFNLRTSLFWFIGLIFFLWFMLNKTKYGNWIMATGGNELAARARGINTDFVKISLFMITSFLAGFAGIIDSIRISSAYPISGTGYELEVIAMVVVGGTSLFGGYGTIFGTIIGVTLLRSIRNGIVVIGVPGLAYNIFVGVIILAMMTVHALIEKRTTGGD
jgi:simple sugar transport system permease protein